MFKITSDPTNKDETRLPYRQIRDFQMNDDYVKLGEPNVFVDPYNENLTIIDYSNTVYGLKGIAASRYFSKLSKTPHATVAYVAPRFGYATVSVAALAELYGIRAIFFAAAAKTVSESQAVISTFKGCEIQFMRVASLSNMHRKMKHWCENNSVMEIPMGLKNATMVSAGIAASFIDYALIHGEPAETYSAMSSGTLSRAMQIAWPNANHKAVAVARSIQAGEKGVAEVISSDVPFSQKCAFQPSFPTTANYDAKAYKLAVKTTTPNSVFINVGADKVISDRVRGIDLGSFDSQKEWGDEHAFDEI